MEFQCGSVLEGLAYWTWVMETIANHFLIKENMRTNPFGRDQAVLFSKEGVLKDQLCTRKYIVEKGFICSSSG